MKIDFNARFAEIEKFLRRTANPQLPGMDAKQNFSNLLGSISPDRPKIEENVAILQAKPPPEPPRSSANSGPMASLNSAPPTMMAPLLDPLGTDLMVEGVGESAPESVKTPTLLDAQRIKTSSANRPEAPHIAQVRRLVENAGIAHGVDPLLGMAVVKAESSFDPKAVSSDGHKSKGLFQLLDTTGTHLLKNMGLEQSYDPFNPSQNVTLGVGYLRYLHDIFNKPTELPSNLATTPAANSSSLEKLAVAAFNAGEGRVASAQERARKAGLNPGLYESIETYLPEITQQYVTRVLGYRDEFEQAGATKL